MRTERRTWRCAAGKRRKLYHKFRPVNGKAASSPAERFDLVEAADASGRIVTLSGMRRELIVATCTISCTMPEVHAGVVWHIRPKQPDGIPELMIGAIQ